MIDRVRRAHGASLELRIELGRAHLPGGDAASLAAPAVLTLDKLVDEPVDILIAGRLVARGEVLVMDGSFCVRVTELVKHDP